MELTGVWASLSAENEAFVKAIDGKLSVLGYQCKAETIDKGTRVTYTGIKPRRAILNYVVQDDRVLLHLYTDSIASYADSVGTLPEPVRKFLMKGPKCKWLEDPAACNPKCLHGYQYELQGETLRKCRYMCYKFEIGDDNREAARLLIEWESEARSSLVNA